MFSAPKSRQARKEDDRCCPADEDAQLTSEDDSCLEDEEDNEDSCCPTCFI